MEYDNNFAFDGTINEYPYHYTNKIIFTKKNINYYNDNDNTNLDFLFEKYNKIFLKMDIEGGEYPFLLNINVDKLKLFTQIVIEFHGINDNSWNCNYEDKIKCLEKLSNTHYLIHVHGNNYGGIMNNIPNVIECTFINKNYYKGNIELNKINLPIVNLDYPNIPNIKNYDLNFYPFVHN